MQATNAYELTALELAQGSQLLEKKKKKKLISSIYNLKQQCCEDGFFFFLADAVSLHTVFAA